MYVLNEFMEFDVDTPHIATYNFKLVFHLLFLTIYSSISASVVLVLTPMATNDNNLLSVGGESGADISGRTC